VARTDAGEPLRRIGPSGSILCMSRFGKLSVVLCFATAVSIVAAAEKQRDWQTGKVLDSQRSRYFAGTVGNANTTGTAQANGNYGTYQDNTNTTQTAVYRTYENFVIEGDKPRVSGPRTAALEMVKASESDCEWPREVRSRKTQAVRD
jgi:hypothetical protein